MFARGDDFLSALDNCLIKSDQKSTIHTLNCKHLPAPASNELPVLQTSGFLLNTSTSKYYDLLLLSHLENASIMRRTVSTKLGPISREVNTFRVYFGCHKSRPIFKMTTFHFKSSNCTISPLFSRLKHVVRPHFKMSFLIRSGGSYHNVPSDWLRKQSTHSKKQQKE